MQLVIKLKTNRGSASTADIFKSLEQRGFHVSQMHPGIDDPELGSYYNAEVIRDGQNIEAIINELLANDVVDGAYLKPDAGMA